MASPSCTPTTLYSTAYLTTTTEVVSPSSTLSRYTTHSTSLSVHTVCAGPPGLGCILPFIQTDVVDVFGRETMVTIQVTRIETLTETVVQGVKTVPCERGLETGKASAVAGGSIHGASATSVAQPSASSSVVSYSSSLEEAGPAQTQDWSSSINSASSAIVAISAEASFAESEYITSSQIDNGQDADPTATATLTTTRYSTPAPFKSIAPSDAETATSRSSKGEIVGIVLGVLVGLLVLGVAVAGLVHWWRKREREGGEEIDEDEIQGWRKSGAEKDEGCDEDPRVRSQRFSTAASMLSTVSRLAHLARRPYASPLLRSAPAYGDTTSRAQRSSRGTIDGQTIKSNRLSHADLGSLVLHERVPPMPFNASSLPHSPDGTVSSFGGDVEVKYEKSPRARNRLAPWEPPLR